MPTVVYSMALFFADDLSMALLGG